MYLNIYTVYSRRVGARIVTNLQVGSLPSNRCFISDRNNRFITTRHLSDWLYACIVPSNQLYTQ